MLAQRGSNAQRLFSAMRLTPSVASAVSGERRTLLHLLRSAPDGRQPRLRALRAAYRLRNVRVRGVQGRRLRFREREGISSGFGRWLFTSDPSGGIAIVGGMFHRSLRPSIACQKSLCCKQCSTRRFSSNLYRSASALYLSRLRFSTPSVRLYASTST